MDKDKFLQKLNSTNKLCQNGNVSYSKLMVSGIKLASHVSNRLPNDYLVIRRLETDFFEAIQQLNRQDVIGLSLEGYDIGRSGSLEWINISSSTCTFLFNITSLGSDAFDNGLKLLLENKRIVKVIHDCRRASDCFHHQYNTKPSNVYDTQVADFVVNAIKKNIELVTNKVNSLNDCLKLYLNVPEECLCKYFNASLKLSSLPLNPDLLQFLINNVIYLRMLKQELDIILRMPFRRCIDVYLNVILKKEDHELQLHPPDFQLLPPELVIENMKVFKLTDKLKPPDSSKPERKEDPFIRYERDCRKYQQKYGYGKYADDKELGIDLDCENVEGGWSYSNRNEIIQFLLDRMFSGDSCDRSEISMTPFENLSDQDDYSVVLEEDICNMNFGHDLKHDGKALPNCASPLSETKLSPASKPLKLTKKFNQPFENLSSSDGSSMSPENVNAHVVDINLSTFPDANKPSDSKHAESLSYDSSFSKKSQVYKMFAEQRHSLASHRPSESVLLAEDSKRVENLPSAKINSNDVKDSVCDNCSSSSLSGKSQIYRKIAEQKCLLSSNKDLQNESVISGKDYTNDIHSALEKSNFVEESVSDNSSDSSLSRKFQITYRRFAEQKRLLNHRTQLACQSVIPERGSLSAEVNSNDVKVSDISFLQAPSSSVSSFSHKSPSFSERLKNLIAINKLSKNQCGSENESLPSSSMQPSMPLKETIHSLCVDREDNSSKNSFSSMNGFSDHPKSLNGVNSVTCDADDLDLCNIDENNPPTHVQDEDPWARLREAFSELGPERYSTKKVVFVPAGMQY